MTPTPLLETSNLTIRFGGVTAVNTVNFSLKEQELRCLIGPNGAGKSTFFKLLTGQLQPTEGHVHLRGQDISGALPHQISRLGVGIKTQVPNVFNAMTVAENLWIAARQKHTSRFATDLADSIMTQLRLTAIAKREVGQLSHGQRQWVEIGTVLAGEPDLILLDEPAAGMTHDEVERTAELILEINKERALIVVEHDMQFIKMIAKTVTVLHQGAVLIEDDVRTVLQDKRVQDVYLGKGVAA
ncbi:ATP-binding cassette domain-containing protein [Roseobacter sp.]|uniref:ATP-binding cassette domain-containing protein n=1 Tax=Roseobacter sp. TaxID=1907202 RepID=UPI003296C81A